MKKTGYLFIGGLTFAAALACNTPQIGISKSQNSKDNYSVESNVTHSLNRKTVLPFPADDEPYLDNGYFDFSAYLPEPDETELGYPFKDVTLAFSANDKYTVQVKDPKLFAEGNVEIIDLGLIGEDEYAMPMKGARVVSRYAGRRVNHTGMDLAGRSRDPIYAVFDGVVRVSKRSDSYGNVIVVRHYNGLETVYSHNTKNMVKVGEEVKAGQQIAVSGRTGRASGDHLHFEVRVNGQHFNPELIFDFKNQRLNDKSLYCVQKGNRIKVSQVDPLPTILAFLKPVHSVEHPDHKIG